MSRREQLRAEREASIRARSHRPSGRTAGRDTRDPGSVDPARSLDRLVYALLPLRIFLGATFVYAGVDKLIDPIFLRATGAGSIGAQMVAFEKVSPLGPLVHLFSQAFPVEIGLLIAIAEIAVGLGALSGLLFRISASGGFALSVMFWLTASWATKPYYYGPDLPYAFGWLTVALAGTGGKFSVETWLRRALEGNHDEVPVSQERRAVLMAGSLGIAAVAIAGLAGTVGASVFGRSRTDLAATGATPSPTDAASVGIDSASPAATAATRAPTTASGPLLGRVSQLASGRALTFRDPATGDPGVLVKLSDGSIVAFDAVCTHAGCTVGYDRRSGYLLCPCHGAAFDPANQAQAIAGPTDQPLASIPIHVDSASGQITLTG